MNTDDCNGRSYVSGSADSSMEKDFSGGLGGPTVSTPNSQHSSPSFSLNANSIKVELYNDEQLGCGAHPEKHDENWKDEEHKAADGEGSSYTELTGPEPMSPGPIRLPNGKLQCDICGMVCIGPNVLMVHRRSHTGERPFQCNQCGASFTQKGNLLRHIKLHSGEKPFKCPFCNYACRRRDALSGHLRTHSVSYSTAGKPYKCNYCGRSYKQRTTMEEHLERCHSYLQSLETRTQQGSHGQGETLQDAEFASDPLAAPPTDKLSFIDRLTNSITKRKRSTPQRFVGEKKQRLEPSSALKKEEDPLVSHPGSMDPTGYAGMSASYFPGPGEGGGAIRLPLQHPEFTSVISSIYGQVTPARLREAGEGHEDSHVPSPSNGCHHSSDSESSPEEQQAPPPSTENVNHQPAPLQAPPSTPTPAPLPSEAFRVVDGEGRPVRSFRCEHCRILFLDHVMFTIHMGCHGFRQPFECNICGHRSQDRYEFSSHIIRGEHKVG